MRKPGQQAPGDHSERVVQAPRGSESDPVRLAGDIQRIRQQLTSAQIVNNPRVSAELHELYQQIAAALGPIQGRHRLLVGVINGSARGPGVGRSGAVGPPARDVSGLDLRPDPLTATSPAELVAVLQRYRQWAGEPSFRVMAAQATTPR
jgi:hypothetical protein